MKRLVVLTAVILLAGCSTQPKTRTSKNYIDPVTGAAISESRVRIVPK